MTPSQTLTTVSDYFLSELRSVDWIMDPLSKFRPGYNDPWQDTLSVREPRAFIIWITVFRAGEHKGLVQVDGYTNPFPIEDLIAVGSPIVAKIQQNLAPTAFPA